MGPVETEALFDLDETGHSTTVAGEPVEPQKRYGWTYRSIKMGPVFGRPPLAHDTGRF
jgi:hypothetical protein